ncbi:MAG: Gldg family protein [Candidatus Magnetoovum sp. WYHC-5]|nr:Gldg family protein [Candidatus Magnetoovum sp. WYHC-5]
MKNISTIALREFSVYFQSLIGYLYIIIFLLISVGLYMTPFFTFPVADMRGFFGSLPLILCIFVPAVTMRLWAEERKENTFEMLLTFPMKTYEIVLGKFISSLGFYAISIAGTIVIPLMLAFLGKPDGGQIFTSYVGAILLGSMLLALGIFISGLCKDQITAFIVTLLVAIAMFLLGTDFFQTYIDGVFTGFGSLVGEIFGFLPHYESFEMGILELTHVFYFISWTVLFLFFNGFFLEIRNRPQMKITFSAALALILAIGLLINWILTDLQLGRIDMTQGKVHTISEGTNTILAKLKVPVNLKVYITPKDKMPTEMKTLERDIVDKLKELRFSSKGMLNYDVIYMEASNIMEDDEQEQPKDEKEEAIEKRMLDKGVKPFSAQSIREDSVVNVLVYSSIGIAYKELKEELIPQIVPQNLHELEYLIMSNIYKMTRDKTPIVAMVAPKDAFNINPMMKKIYMQMGKPIPESDDPYTYLEEILKYEKYDVERIDLTAESPLPDNFDTLVVVNPRSLNDRQKYEINKALVSGKNVFLAVQKYMWNYQIQSGRVNVTRQEESPQIDELLKTYGVTISDDILMDVNHQPLSVSDPSNPFASLLGGGITLNLPMQILLGNSSMNQDVSITSRLSNLFYLWGTALNVDNDTIKKNNLTLTTLMHTSDKAWTIPSSVTLTKESFNEPADGFKQFPVSVIISGQFPDAYKDKPLPKWPADGTQEQSEPPQDIKEEVKSAPGKLILIGGTQMFKKELIHKNTLDFYLNSVDALTMGEDLIKIRAKQIVDRTIPMPSNTVKAFWKFFNYILINALVAFIGVSIIMRKKRSREAYTASYNRGGGYEK